MHRFASTKERRKIAYRISKSRFFPLKNLLYSIYTIHSTTQLHTQQMGFWYIKHISLMNIKFYVVQGIMIITYLNVVSSGNGQSLAKPWHSTMGAAEI